MKNCFIWKKALALATAAAICCSVPVYVPAEETVGTESVEAEYSDETETEESSTVSAADAQTLAEEAKKELNVTMAGDDFLMSPKADLYISFGADVTLNTRSLMMALAGLSYDNIENYTACALTSKEEHGRYDELVDAELIGNRASVSTFFLPMESNGLNVCTYNISDCTPTMYKCALVTAGFENGGLIVAAPESTTGVTGILGVLKSYETGGTNLNLDRKEMAIRELVLMQKLTKMMKDADPVLRDGLIIYLKNQMVKGKMEDEKAIEKCANKYAGDVGLSISGKAMKLITAYFIDLAGKGFDLERMEKGNKPLLKELNAYIEDMNTSATQKFFNSVKAFFNGLFN